MSLVGISEVNIAIPAKVDAKRSSTVVVKVIAGDRHTELCSIQFLAATKLDKLYVTIHCHFILGHDLDIKTQRPAQRDEMASGTRKDTASYCRKDKV